MGATIRDVAALCNLSLGTVSKYLNGKPIKDINRIKIEQAIEQLNFKPNNIAKGLRNAKTFTVAVLIPSLSDIFVTEIITAVEQYLLPRGYSVIVSECQSDADIEMKKIELLINRMVDGIILLPYSVSGKQIDYINQHDIPLVLIDRMMPGHATDTVILDNVKSTFEPTKALIEKGHKDIGIICGDPDHFTTTGRLQGYLDALNAYKIPVKPQFITYGGYTMEGGCNALEQLWSNTEYPTGIVVTNYEMTIGAFIAINNLKIHIPNDLSIIGFDTLPLEKIISPPLSITSQPFAAMGLSVAKLLYKRLQGDYTAFPETVVHEPLLSLQKSIKPIT